MATVRMRLSQARTKLTAAEKARLDGLTDKQINAAARSDPDNPPSTRKELAQMAAIVRARGRPAMKADERKVRLTLRVPAEVVRHYRGTGPGWQTRISEILERAAKRAAK